MTSINIPLVSIIVPVYNVEDYLDACLNSIKQQTYEHLEIIVVEDCSTDSSNQVLQKHLKDERVKLIFQNKNSGLSAARNRGIQTATGEYLMFVDSDDIIDLSFVETALHCALESAADVVLLNVRSFSKGEAPLSSVLSNTHKHSYQSIEPIDYFKYPHFAWLKFIRSELLKDQNIRFPIDQYYEDWPFHWQLGFVISNIVKADGGYYHYRQRKDSITGAGDQKLLHMFLSSQRVACLAEQYKSCVAIKELLPNRIYSGLWFVLTNIDKRYLEEAVLSAKQHLIVTQRYRKGSSPMLKERLLLFYLKLPTPIALLAITNLRIAVNHLSSARRQAQRS